MEISKKDIKCKEIVEQIEQYTSSIRQFIRLVNREIPKGQKLNKEKFIIVREDDISFLDDGNTRTPGFRYNVFWAYTQSNQQINKAEILRLIQENAVTFVFTCYERCYDHRKSSLIFLELYYNNSNERAERIDYINDNYDKNHLFSPYEITQVVWRISNDLNVNYSKIPEDKQMLEKYSEKFQKDKVELILNQSHSKISRELPQKIQNSIENFENQVNIFASIVRNFSIICSATTPSDLKSYLKEGIVSDTILNDIIDLALFLEKVKEDGKKYGGTFRWQKDGHYTLHDNERENTFTMFNCIKCILGYSYFNEYVFMEGISKNWHPRLLYFSYYISEDLKETYYTISMTSFEGRTRKNYMNLIEAKTLEELLSAENAIKIAKWFEEILKKKQLVNYYSSIIYNEKIRNFNPSYEIE